MPLEMAPIREASGDGDAEGDGRRCCRILQRCSGGVSEEAWSLLLSGEGEAN